MRSGSRWLLIGLAAVATGVLIMVDRTGGESTSSPRERTTPAAQTPPPGLFTRLPQRSEFDGRGDLFAARSWAPPAPARPPPAPAKPPAEPQAQEAPPAPPPNPYRFAGTALQDGVLKTFLAAGDRLFEAREGEVLEPGFRVESVTREVVVLVYEALGTKHQIELAPALVPAQAQRGGRAADAGPTAGPAR